MLANQQYMCLAPFPCLTHAHPHSRLYPLVCRRILQLQQLLQDTTSSDSDSSDSSSSSSSDRRRKKKRKKRKEHKKKDKKKKKRKRKHKPSKTSSSSDSDWASGPPWCAGRFKSTCSPQERRSRRMTFPLRSFPSDRKDPKIQNSNDHDSPLSPGRWMAFPPSPSAHSDIRSGCRHTRVDACKCVTRECEELISAGRDCKPRRVCSEYWDCSTFYTSLWLKSATQRGSAAPKAWMFEHSLTEQKHLDCLLWEKSHWFQ